MRRGALTAILLLIALFFSPIQAQEEKLVFDDACVARLINSLQNENEGVRKCAAYLSGNYKINEAVPQLISLLENDKCDNVRCLAAHALFKIQSIRSLEAIYKASYNDKNEHIKNLCRAMILEISNDDLVKNNH